MSFTLAGALDSNADWLRKLAASMPDQGPLSFLKYGAAGAAAASAAARDKLDPGYGGVTIDTIVRATDPLMSDYRYADFGADKGRQGAETVAEIGDQAKQLADDFAKSFSSFGTLAAIVAGAALSLYALKTMKGLQ